MECLLHRNSKSSKDKVVPFTEFTFAKVQECCKAWKTTMSSREIAIANDFECAVLERVEYYGYHVNCYNQFTRKSSIAKARQEARQAVAKSLRPPSAVVAQMVVPEDIFPYECFFCHTVSKMTLNRCRRPKTASNILAAAIQRKDQHILDQIVGEDLVGRRLAYHAKCYLKYTNVTRQTPVAKYPALDEEAFRNFVANVTTEEREGRRCVPITAMKDLFVKTVADDGEGDSLREKVTQQTVNLRKHCPYRMFSGGKLRNKPEMMAVPRGLGSVEDAACLNNGEVAGDDAADSYNEHGDYSKFAQQFAMYLHEKMRDEQVGSLPPELPKFLAWCTNEVDSPCYAMTSTCMSQERQGRIVAIAQDIAALTAEHASRSK